MKITWYILLRFVLHPKDLNKFTSSGCLVLYQIWHTRILEVTASFGHIFLDISQSKGFEAFQFCTHSLWRSIFIIWIYNYIWYISGLGFHPNRKKIIAMQKLGNPNLHLKEMFVNASMTIWWYILPRYFETNHFH